MICSAKPLLNIAKFRGCGSYHHHSSIKSFIYSNQCNTMATNNAGHFNFEDAFSPENKKRTIESLSTHQSISTVEHLVGKVRRRKASVLIPLCYDEESNTPSILYNLRSKTMTKHKGEISFPGGACDPEDNDDLVITALRETEEELGIDRHKIDIWTTLPYVPTVTSLIRVAPVLGFIKEPINPKTLHINQNEVEFAFTVPLSHLCDPNNWGMTNFTKYCQKISMPEFKNLETFMNTGHSHSESTKGPVILWGLTSIVTHVVLSALVPQVYKRDILITRGINPIVQPKI